MANATQRAARRRQRQRRAARAQSVRRAGARRVRGRGDYTDEPDESQCPESIQAIARQLGGRAGRSLGNYLGGGISRLFGRGDYDVKVNSLMSSYTGASYSGPPPPATFRGPNHGTRVVEREFIATITGHTTFTNQSFRINPADPTTFPWLSRLAQTFEQWDPHGIVFEFRSTSSTYNGASQALGAVMMATDYDASDAAYSTRIAMSNSDYATTLKSSDSGVHGVECDPAVRPTEVLFTAATTTGLTGPELRMNDLGTFQIATDGLAANAVIGELWVAYDITFYKKSLSEDLTPVGVTKSYYGSAGFSIGSPLGTTVATTVSHEGIGSTASYAQGSGLRVNLDPPDGNVARALVTLVATQTAAAGSPTVVAPYNCAVTTTTNVNNTAGLSYIVDVDVTGNDAFFTITFTSVAFTGVTLSIAYY